MTNAFRKVTAEGASAAFPELRLCGFLGQDVSSANVL